MGTTGTTQFLQQKLLEETPIFSKTRVDFTPSHPLTHLVVAAGNVVMAQANRSLVRVERQADGATTQTEVDLTGLVAGAAKVSGLFLDPSGQHLLVAVKAEEPELLYLHRRWTRPRSAARFRGCLVTSVAWAQGWSGPGTGPLLCGTSLGLIIETELSADERFFSSSVEQQYRQLFDLGKGQHTPVTGLQYHCVPNTSRYLVLATTPTRLYQFQGSVASVQDRPLLQQVFTPYLTAQERFLELPSTLRSSALSLHYPDPTTPFPAQFGWLTQPGLYWGRLDPWQGDQDSVTVDCQLIPAVGDTPARTGHITQFHALLLYPDRVRGVCLLNQQPVLEEVYSGEYGGLVGLSLDQTTGICWVYSEYAVYRYQVVNESRHVWRVYLEQGQYNLALRHCGNQPAALDLILTRQADQLFSEGKWVESAMHYAKTKSSFEEVTLKFLNLSEKAALKNYLKKKLETLKPGEKTQITLIVLWLVEIYQAQLGELRDGGAGCQQLEAEFHSVLRQARVLDCVRENRAVVYSVLGSHGDQAGLGWLASQLGDTEQLVQLGLRRADYAAVLEVLAAQTDPEQFYRHGPVLLAAAPGPAVDCLISQGGLLEPGRLLPGLLGCPEPGQAARYLQHCVEQLQCRDPACHNLLVQLYIAHRPERVLPYLTGQDRHCDPGHALRLCRAAGLAREAVQLYCMLGQHEAATRLALTIDTELAVTCAAGKLAGELAPELSRKLWLQVAKHVVQEKNDIKQAMEFLKECPSVKIEDILPFFPDFVTIDHFKEAICDSLQQYSDNIGRLKEEMAEAARSAAVIREEIVSVRAEHQVVKATARCCSCSALLLSRPFFLFSCSHAFHTDCLVEAVLPHLTPARQRRVRELQTVLDQPEPDTASLDSRSATPDKRREAETELEDLVASECLLCGDIMVRNIDKPFIDDAEFDREMAEWL